VLKLLKLTKIARIITPLFLLVVICYITNTTVNQHFHKLSSGIIVNHAHPFDRSSTGTPFQNHKHSTPELTLLDQISTSVFWIYLFYTFLSLLLTLSPVYNNHLQITLNPPDLFFLRNYHAPPAAVISK